MRAAAEKGDLTSFKKGLPSSFKNADGLMKQVRRGMNLAAGYGFGVGTYRPIASLEQFEQNQIRDLYVREMIFNINDKVDYIKEDINNKLNEAGFSCIKSQSFFMTKVWSAKKIEE